MMMMMIMMIIHDGKPRAPAGMGDWRPLSQGDEREEHVTTRVKHYLMMMMRMMMMMMMMVALNQKRDGGPGIPECAFASCRIVTRNEIIDSGVLLSLLVLKCLCLCVSSLEMLSSSGSKIYSGTPLGAGIS